MKRFLLAAVLLSGVFVASCGGGGDNDVTSGTNSECKSCLDTKCKTQVDQCNANSECVALSNCLKSCKSNDCMQKCLMDHQDGYPYLQSLSSCAAQNCANECKEDKDKGTPDTGDNGGNTSGNTGGNTGGDNSCKTCMQTKCSSQLNQCAANPECVALIQCIDPCNDDACVQNCAQQHPNGVSDVNNIVQCVQTNCSAECGG